MKKLLLITIILILQSFPSFATPNGNGIVCKCDRIENGKGCPYTYPIRGYLFLNNKVFGSFFIKEKDTYKITYSETVNYYTSVKQIYWYSSINDLYLSHTLNRKTLELKSTNEYYSFVSKCKLFDKKKYNNEIQSIIDSLQFNYDKKRKDNKI